MSQPTLLITGSSGYVGFKILLDALSADHKVLATVRSESTAEKLKGRKALQQVLAAHPSASLDLAIVPDITKGDAFDAALSGGSITHIIHVASPLGAAPGDLRQSIIEPALRGTLSILEAASRAPSVRRVVNTASIASNIDYATTDASAAITANTQLADPTQEAVDAAAEADDRFTGYRYSKTMAWNAANRFVRNSANPPHFDIVHVLPGFVHGANLNAESREEEVTSSNTYLLKALRDGVTIPDILASTTHIDDSAAVHLAALKESVVPFRSGIDLAPVVPADQTKIIDILEKHFPQALADGTLKRGHVDIRSVNYSAGDLEQRVGIKLKSFETMIVDTLTHYLSLPEKA